MTLSQTVPTFQSRIQEIAVDVQAPVERVFALWRIYANRCNFADQSPTLPEFADWLRRNL